MSKKIFTDDHAELTSARSGQSYRPSNGMEGELFEVAFCDNCTKCESCDIIMLSMVNDIGNKDYPPQMQYAVDGQPTCTEFDEQR